MYKCQKFNVGIALLFTGLFLFNSCKNEIEPSLGYSLFPAETGSVIYGSFTPIKILFQSPIVMEETESKVDVIRVWDHNSVRVAGRIHWDEMCVSFVPDNKWLPGEKYKCALNGLFVTQNEDNIAVKEEFVFFTAPDIGDEQSENNVDDNNEDNNIGNGNDNGNNTQEPEPVHTVPEIESALIFNAGGTNDSSISNNYWENVIADNYELNVQFNIDMNFENINSLIEIAPAECKYEVKAIDKNIIKIIFKKNNAKPPIKRIDIKIGRDIESLDGIALNKEIAYSLTEWIGDLRTPEIFVENKFYRVSQSTIIKKGGTLTDDELKTVIKLGIEHAGYSTDDAGIRTFDFTFNFSDELPDEDSFVAELEKIMIYSEELRTGQQPMIFDSFWDPEDGYNQTCLCAYFGEEPNKPVRYKLVIPGGIEGINDWKGHYLKETTIVNFDVYTLKILEDMYGK